MDLEAANRAVLGDRFQLTIPDAALTGASDLEPLVRDADVELSLAGGDAACPAGSCNPRQWRTS
jgi:hypothetical protein